MVEPVCRNSVRRDWRDYRQECPAAYRRGRGFYRALIGRLELRGGAGGRRRRSIQTLLATACLLGASTLPLTSFASTPTTVGIGEMRNVSYNDALMAYEDGNKTLALVNAKIAGSNGDADAQVMVGHILQRGETGLIDVDEAAKWFRSAAQNDHADALVALGEMALRAQADMSPTEALPWLTRAADQGRADAMRVIADMYAKGTGVAIDTAIAQQWLIRANAGGDMRAARRMGDILIESDAKAALDWYEKAAAKGDAEAAYIAAVMYAENIDIRPNSKKAVVLMRQAAEAGIVPAQADYGLLVYQGAGVEQSTDQAAKWFSKAARGGDKEGQFLYAFTLAKGEGVDQDFEEAYYWLLKSGESSVDAYEADRSALRERLDQFVDAPILDRARARFYEDEAREAAK